MEIAGLAAEIQRLVNVEKDVVVLFDMVYTKLG